MSITNSELRFNDGFQIEILPLSLISSSPVNGSNRIQNPHSVQVNSEFGVTNVNSPSVCLVTFILIIPEINSICLEIIRFSTFPLIIISLPEYIAMDVPSSKKISFTNDLLSVLI